VDTSILELQAGPVSRGRTRLAIRAAWWAVGPAGRGITVAGIIASAAVAAWWVPVSPAAVATGVALAVLTTAALVDAVRHRLPNVLVALAAVPVAAALAVAWSGPLLWGALAGAAFLGVPLLVTHLVAPAGMGFGDVKAGIVLGAALGLLGGPLALLALVLGLALAAVWGLARRAKSIALGPALVAGALLALAVGRLVGGDPVSP
jgi:leader peptidase (prepilin peptidase) / N-methyltransferase